MKVLVIDDEVSLLKLLQLSLKSDFDLSVAETGRAGTELFSQDTFDCVVCDVGLPDQNGIEVLKQIRNLNSELPIIMITAHGTISSALSAMKAGAYDYIQKPFEPEELKIVIERAIHERNLSSNLARLQREVSEKYDFSKIIGQSQSMRTLFDRVRKAADTKSTILILGESGTGKELIAKSIHFNSSRSEAPFIVIDCSAIPHNLLESELFGHARGAFTGADRAKKGLFEEAHHGTVFLDEIGELPLDLQAKLLRVLQESTIRRVGENQSIDIDIRVIAATNRNLEEEAKAGRFRQDLFYRLNVVPISAPPLRQRSDDIPLLANHFIKKFSKEYSRQVQRISPSVIARFQSFEWPGNVRQLENLIEQMVVMSNSEILEMQDLPPPLSEGVPSEPAVIPQSLWDLKSAIQKITHYTEECLIKKALQHTGYNKTKAAELLGISRRALIYKAQEYRIEKVTPQEIEGNEDDPS
jgi:DNA-binding NtrC family response regulator